MRKVENIFRDPETGDLRSIMVEEQSDGRALVTIDGTLKRLEVACTLTTITWLATTLGEYLKKVEA